LPENKSHNLFTEQLQILKDLARWIPIAAAVGLMAGTASAVLLSSLTYATNLRESHPWLILLLAPAGWAMGMLYKLFGQAVEGGNNLILEEVHDPQDTIPVRMTPLILIATFVSHVFGASVGREGTALQTGASLADQLTRPLRLTSAERRILLMAGISAGFGSVFGTPMAGAVFGIEVLAIGKISYDAIAPCFLAAFVGDLVTRTWARHVPGITHTHYFVGEVPAMSLRGIALAAIAGIAFGLTAMAFSRLTHFISRNTRRWISRPEFRPIAGGIVVTAAVFAMGTTRYIGLGLPVISGAFVQKLPPWDFAGKLLFTATSIGTGFKGGEVTPLFYIGATLGNALSRLLPLPPGLLAGMGFAAVFAGAANTPISSTLLAVELFGGEAGAYAAIACVMSYLFSGHTGIYGSQRRGSGKFALRNPPERESLAMLAKRDLGECLKPGTDPSSEPQTKSQT